MRFSEDSHGGDLRAKYDFSVNISPLGMSEGVFSACVEALKRADRYPDPYCRELRRALAEKEGVSSDNILAGNGAAELIYAFAASRAGETVAVLSPTFSEYANATKAYGGNVRFLSGLTSVNEKSLRGVRTLFICVPNNPDGFMPSRVELFELIEKCKASGVEVFVDACFFDFVDSPEYTLCELLQFSNVVVLQALTKSYALAGVRVGYLMGNRAQLSEISVKLQPWNVSAVAQAAGAAAASEKEYLVRLRAAVKEEREHLEEGLRRAGYAPFPSSANFLLFEGDKKLALRLRKSGIAIRDCGDFVGLVAQKGNQYYRIGVRTRAENEALIRELLKEKDQ